MEKNQTQNVDDIDEDVSEEQTDMTEQTEMSSSQTDNTTSEGKSAKIKNKKLFKDYVKKLVEDFKIVTTYTDAYYVSRGKPVATITKRGQSVLVDRTELGKNLTLAKKNYIDALQHLNSMYTNSTKRTRKNSNPNIILIKESLIKFFEDTLTDLEQNPKKNEKLNFKKSDFPMLLSGYSNNSILLSLFSVYMRVNELQHPENRQFLKGDELMRKHFSSFFEKLSLKGETLDKNGKRSYPPQTIDKFRFCAFRSVILAETIHKTVLTPTQIEFLQKDPEELQRKIQLESDIVKNVLNQLKSTSEEDGADLEEDKTDVTEK